MAKKTKNKDIEKAAMPKSKPDVINKDIMDMVDFKNYEKEKGKLHPEDPRAGDNMDTGKAFYEEGDKTLESEIERLINLAKERKKFLGKEVNAAKGGSMTKQMEMFEEGGLKDEGGTVDEASGNDVPIGSTKEEVRDDIPAQLSEGEFVFPADVVRFIGLEKLMQMRQKAKMGLKKMEAMGQMGNSDEATMPDDMPFSMDDLDMKDEEDTQSNFNRGGVVTMAIGGTTPTTENTSQNTNVTMNESNLNPKQTSVPIRTDSTPIVQQRTTTQQKPLNIRQEAVPIRGQVTNIPSSADFLKKKSSEVTPTYDLEGAIPSNIGSRFITSKAETQQKQDVQSVKNEIDAILSDDSYDSDSDTGDYSGPTFSTSLDYAAVDRFSLDDDLRGVFNDFSKAQLSMFGVVTSSPIGLALSGIGTQLGPMTGGKTVQGPVYSAEVGKMQAKAFHQVALDITNKYGVTSINGLSAAGQKELANQGRVHMDFAKDIYNASVGKPYSSFSFNEKDNKGFLDTAKGIVDSVMSMGKTQSSMPTPEIAAKQKSMANLHTNIISLATKSLQTKNNKAMLDTVKEAVAASKAPTTTAAVDKLGNINKANEHGFNAYGTGIADRQGTVTGVDKSGAISYSPNHNWGKPTQTRVTNKDVAKAKETTPTPNDPNAGSYGIDPSPDPYGGTDPMGNPTGVTGPASNTSSGYDNQGPDGGDSSDNGSHICTATYNTGHINKEHFTTLKKYGILLRRTDPYMMKAYDVFGPKVASLVNSNKYVTSFAKFITQYYKDTMDNKPLSIKQKLFNILSVTILRPMWRLIGRFV